MEVNLTSLSSSVQGFLESPTGTGRRSNAGKDASAAGKLDGPETTEVRQGRSTSRSSWGAGGDRMSAADLRGGLSRDESWVSGSYASEEAEPSPPPWDLDAAQQQIDSLQQVRA